MTVIGSSFLAQSGVTNLDLSEMTSVTKIGNQFCSSCTSLKTIDLTALHRVVKVKYGFLESCTSLESIDLSAFGNVAFIESEFLRKCTSLKTVDLSVLRSIIHIEQNWLQGCSALTTANFSGMSNVTLIDSCFLQDCTSLTTLDMSGFGRDTEIQQRNFLINCNALTTVVLPGNIDIDEMLSLPNGDPRMSTYKEAFYVRVREIYARFAEQFRGVRIEAFEAVQTDVSGSARQCIALKAGQEREGIDASTRGQKRGTKRGFGELGAA